jgi:hypothetical protein
MVKGSVRPRNFRTGGSSASRAASYRIFDFSLIVVPSTQERQNDRARLKQLINFRQSQFFHLCILSGQRYGTAMSALLSMATSGQMCWNVLEGRPRPS